MTPTLPRHDPDPRRRAHGLDTARERYAFRYDYHDLAAIVDLPLAEKSDVRWMAAIAEVFARLEINDLRIRGAQGIETAAERVRAGLASLLPEQLVARRRANARRVPPDGFDAYDRMYGTIPLPPIAGLWQRDDVFAYQAVAGTNPVMLKRMTHRLPHFPVTDAQYAAALNGGDSLPAALAEGRLYLADYAALDGLPTGVVDGRQKYNFAPIALYAWIPAASRLVAVAIQCGQTPSRIWTPADGVSWKMARTTVSTAEGNYQGILSHFALCHQVMEAVILSSRRQLSERHPLLVLLDAHFRNTLVANDIAMTSLVGPDGYMERLQSPTLEASLALATRAIGEFRLSESAPVLDFARRGVDDPTALGDYPARDDALLVWRAVRDFVGAYVATYYPSDAEVAGDPELAAWVRELGAGDGGRLAGIALPTTPVQVADLVAQIVFRCTAYHAQFNYSSFDLFSYAPNVQVAAFAPGPTGAGDSEAAWAAMIPPYDLAYQAFHLFFEITPQLDRLGEYPKGHFADPRVAPLLQAHQEALAAVEATVTERNTGRLLAYPYQLPSRIPLAIHV